SRDWSSDVCSSDLSARGTSGPLVAQRWSSLGVQPAREGRVWQPGPQRPGRPFVQLTATTALAEGLLVVQNAEAPQVVGTVQSALPLPPCTSTDTESCPPSWSTIVTL